MDYLTIKLTSEGHIIWSKRYRTTHENFAYCLSMNKSGVYVSGEGELTVGHTGIVSVKYSQLTGNMLEENNQIESYELSNYPNPFNPNTQINFQIPNSMFIKICIYDISGKEIETLVNEYKNQGQYPIINPTATIRKVYFDLSEVNNTNGRLDIVGVSLKFNETHF